MGRNGKRYQAAMVTTLLASGSAFVNAGDVELTATVGYVAPTYNESLSFSLGDLRPLPGVTAVVSRPFQLDAKLGLFRLNRVLFGVRRYAGECGRLSGTSGRPARKMTSDRWFT